MSTAEVKQELLPWYFMVLVFYGVGLTSSSATLEVTPIGADLLSFFRRSPQCLVFLQTQQLCKVDNLVFSIMSPYFAPPFIQLQSTLVVQQPCPCFLSKVLYQLHFYCWTEQLKESGAYFLVTVPGYSSTIRNIMMVRL